MVIEMYSNKLISEILIYINENIQKDISIDDLEKQFYYNRYYIMKLFKKEIKMTIIDYINSIKIYKSLELIKDKYSFTNIAIDVGYNSLEYYSETFKKITGYKPSEFRYFFLKIYMLDNQSIINIRNKIINLNQIYCIKDEYILHMKRPKNGEKILSIFKQKNLK